MPQLLLNPIVLTLALFVSGTGPALAQTFDPEQTTWYDANWNPVPDSLAFYTRYLAGNNTFDYDAEGNLYQVTEYSDSTLREKQGSYVRYHRNGSKAEEGLYRDGKRSGEWLFLDERGKPLTRGTYLEGEKSGTWTYYTGDDYYSYRSPEPDSSGTYVNDQPSGDWFYFYQGDTSAVAHYENGQRTSVTCREIDLDFPPDKPCTDQAARFADGNKAWKKALASDLTYPAELKKQKIRGTVLVSFTVHDNGEVSDISVEHSVHPQLDAIAVDFVENVLTWYPAIRNNRPVVSRITVAIPFR